MGVCINIFETSTDRLPEEQLVKRMKWLVTVANTWNFIAIRLVIKRIFKGF